MIIPGFGGFVANPINAKVSSDNDQFYPPSRQITFNQNLTRNDGLLADKIAEKNDISYDAAVALIDDYVQSTLKSLSEGNEVDISGVGLFNRDLDGVLRFELNKDANFLRGSFGLTSFHSPIIKRDTVERTIEKKIIQAIPKKVTPQTLTAVKERVNIVKYWPAAAVILVLIVSSAILVKTNVLNDISVSSSELNPFSVNAEKEYSPRANELSIEVPVIEKDEIDLWLERIPETPADNLGDVKSKIKKRFHIIGGCFEFMANARKMVRRLTKRGFDPQLVGKNHRGLQRVAFGSYETRKEAREALRYIKNTQMSSAWLYVSKK